MNAAEYDLMYAVEDRHWWYQALRSLIDQMLETHRTSATPLVLDAGCGTGANSVYLAKRAHVVSVDLSPLALQRCRDRSLRRLARANVLTLPFDDETFDTVLAMDVIYHADVADVVEALREFRRVLKPGGLLFVNVPAYEWLRSPHDEAIRTRRRFTRRELRESFEAAGLAVTRLTHWNTLMMPAIVAARRLRAVRQREGSDLNVRASGLAGRAAAAALSVERAALRWVDLPAGVSIFSVATRLPEAVSSPHP